MNNRSHRQHATQPKQLILKWNSSDFPLSCLQLRQYRTFILWDLEKTEDKPTGNIKQKEMELAARNQDENIAPTNMDFILRSQHDINMAPMIFFFCTKYYKIRDKNSLGFEEIFTTTHVGTNESQSPLLSGAITWSDRCETHQLLPLFLWHSNVRAGNPSRTRNHGDSGQHL